MQQETHAKEDADGRLHPLHAHWDRNPRVQLSAGAFSCSPELVQPHPSHPHPPACTPPRSRGEKAPDRTKRIKLPSPPIASPSEVSPAFLARVRSPRLSKKEYKKGGREDAQPLGKVDDGLRRSPGHVNLPIPRATEKSLAAAHATAGRKERRQYLWWDPIVEQSTPLGRWDPSAILAQSTPLTAPAGASCDTSMDTSGQAAGSSSPKGDALSSSPCFPVLPPIASPRPMNVSLAIEPRTVGSGSHTVR